MKDSARFDIAMLMGFIVGSMVALLSVQPVDQLPPATAAPYLVAQAAPSGWVVAFELVGGFFPVILVIFGLSLALGVFHYARIVQEDLDRQFHGEE